ncbi:MAG: HigA family addiction module antidote protein [Opitutaceae bacterium]|jgi:addiction module HigA family antidote|nr:HigA family addiction module antidote protein [Opitutaceae bacterium]
MKTKTIKKIPPMHPGEMIKEDWLADYGLTQYALAKALNIPHSRLTDIIKGRRGITADTALRLARFYGNTPQFWLNLQANYDLQVADASKIAVEVEPLAAAA